MTPDALLPWVLAPPAAGALVLGTLALVAARRGTPGPAALAGPLATVAALISCVLSVIVVLGLRESPGHRIAADLGPWISAGALTIRATLVADPLTAIMLLVVTGVGSVIHAYAIGYMAHDPGRLRFFCYLNLFLVAMLVLVLAGDLVLLFAGWEGVGLCSYLLIGFWWTEPANARAGVKAFLVNRVGDAGMLVGLCLLAWAGLAATGEARLTIEALRITVPTLDPRLAAAAGLLLLLGVCGKSAQLPLSVWLPDAMAGPTPVSALIHAATMVTAGVYLLARLAFLFTAAPLAGGAALAVGAATACVAGVAALGQRDLKRVLAYSTVSQLGFMVSAAGAGAPAAAMFHVVTHAFFKAALFLGAGAVIHACHDEQDLERIAGRAGRERALAAAMGIACLALAGCPPLSGFFSKETVLAAVLASPALPRELAIPAFGALAVAAVATAAYSARLWIQCFRPPPGTHVPTSGDHAPHPVSPLLTGPVILLAVLAALGGLLGAPFAVPGLGAGAIFGWLGTEAPHAAGVAVLGTSLGALALGLAFGVATARRPAPAQLGARGLDRAVAAVGRGVVDLARGFLVPVIEQGLLAAVIAACGLAAYGASAVGRLWHTGRVRGYALAMAVAAVALALAAGAV